MEIAGKEPDIIMLTEVIPKAQLAPIHPALLDIPGFTCLTNFEPSQPALGSSGMRGICIYTSLKINAREVSFPENIFKEQLWVKIDLVGADFLLVGCIYRSPSSTRANDEHLTELLRLAANFRASHLLIAGDFNYGDIDWTLGVSMTLPHNSAHKFIEAVQDCFLTQHVNEPTRHRDGQKSRMLDLVLTNEERILQNMEVLPGLGKSDHAIIRFQLSCYTNTGNAATSKLDFKRANFPQMANLLSIVNWNCMNDMSLEAGLQYLSKQIHDLSNQFIPNIRQMKKKNIYVTREAILLKNKKTRLWKRHLKDYPGKSALVDETNFKTARNELRKLTKKLQRDYEKDIARRSKKSPKIFWSYVNSKLKSKPRLEDLQKQGGGIAITNLDKAKVLSDFFASVFTTENLERTPQADSQYSGQPLEHIQVNPQLVLEKLRKL